MNRYTALFVLILMPTLTGCNALGGIPPEAITNAKNAGASCIRVESLVMGKAVVTTANVDKGVIVNGTVTVNPETCAMTISNAPAPAKPVP